MTHDYGDFGLGYTESNENNENNENDDIFTDSDFLANFIPENYWNLEEMDGTFSNVNTWSHIEDIAKDVKPPYPCFTPPTWFNVPNLSKNVSRSGNGNILTLSTDIQSENQGNFLLTLSDKSLFKFTIRIGNRDIEGQDDWYDTVEATLLAGDSIEIDIDNQRGLYAFNIIKNGQNYIDQNIIHEMNELARFGEYKNPNGYNFELNKIEFFDAYGITWDEAWRDSQSQGEIEIKIKIEEGTFYYDNNENNNDDNNDDSSSDDDGIIDGWSQEDSWTLLGALLLGLLALYLINTVKESGVIELAE